MGDAKVHPTFVLEHPWGFGIATFVWRVEARFENTGGVLVSFSIIDHTVGRDWIHPINTANHVLGVRAISGPA